MPKTIYPVRRTQMVEELKGTYGYMPDDADTIMSYLESRGIVYFNGTSLEIRDPSTPDAFRVAGLANATLGRTMGSQGRYQLKEQLNDLLRAAQTWGVAGKR